MASINGISKPTEPRIAIVGGGIVGVILTLGLLRQKKVSVSVYEQTSSFREIGAGVTFTSCARRCMTLMDPAITEALRRCGAVPISDDDSNDDYLRWIDGYNQHCADDASYQRPLAQICGNGFQGCRRDQFLEELAKEVPDGVIEFRKRLEGLEEREDGTLVLSFVDGTTAEADAVIGCDGIKSKVRQCLLGVDHPASYPQNTHKVAYRGLIPMNEAVDVLGLWKAHNFHYHVGPNAHLAHYPVAGHAALNVAVFWSDRDPWADHNTLVATGTRDEVLTALSGWHPVVLDLVRLLPYELNKWALFDLAEFPMPQYNAGRICVAGDAAHASSPHHGAGACLGVEDALCLSTLLGQVRETTTTTTITTACALEAAFESFDAVRRTRTQWLVNSSRRVCDLYQQSEWGDPKRWVKAETCFEEVRDRSYKIWNFDVEGMVQQAHVEYKRQLGESQERVNEKGIAAKEKEAPPKTAFVDTVIDG